MVRFLNIETGQIFTFNGWPEIIEKGGLKNCLPKQEWKNIWEEKAASETFCMGFLKKNLHNTGDAYKAMMLFKKLDS